MDAATRDFVWHRAGASCEYCRIPQAATPFSTFHVEHIVAKQHGGADGVGNLALACNRCNGYKGPNIAGIDPESGALTPLFHPRLHVWEEHFQIADGRVEGLTIEGRTTAALFQMNSPNRVQLRRLYSQEEEHP